MAGLFTAAFTQSAYDRLIGIKSPSLTMSAVSSTFGAHCPVHSEERAISLSLKMCRSNQGSLVIGFQVRNLSPTHASLRSYPRS
jgi:hypothetical protein